MKEVIIGLSSVLICISYLIFIIAILKGRAKPHRTSRLVILATSSIAAASLFTQPDNSSFWLAAVFTFNSFIIFVLSIKYGMGGWAKTDIACLILAFIGIVLWKITNDPMTALFASIGADFIGVIPTLIKTYRLPKTEVWLFYFLDAIAAFLNMLTIPKWTIDQYAFPIYIIVVNVALVALILRPTKQTDKSA